MTLWISLPRSFIPKLSLQDQQTTQYSQPLLQYSLHGLAFTETCPPPKNTTWLKPSQAEAFLSFIQEASLASSSSLRHSPRAPSGSSSAPLYYGNYTSIYDLNPLPLHSQKPHSTFDYPSLSGISSISHFLVDQFHHQKKHALSI